MTMTTSLRNQLMDRIDLENEKDTCIYDPIHGFVEITPLMRMCIDTPEFQRLRELKQLGAVHYVFPSATHTRFEHSIGTSYLAGTLMTQLKKRQPELFITERDIELVRMAGLLHDLGHGPFSHLYDHYIRESDEEEHEMRGIRIFRGMVKRYRMPLEPIEVEYICDMINPSEIQKHNWRYQIIANKFHSIDVDKMDYIQRDSYHLGLSFGGDYKRIFQECRVVKYEEHHVLAWSEKSEFDLFSLFSARYRLHKQVLTHHKVKAYEYIIIRIFKILRKIGWLETRCFLNWTDSMITQRHLHTDPEIYVLQFDMDCRRVPRLYYEKISSSTEPSSEPSTEPLVMMDKESYIVDQIELGYMNTNRHPLYEIIYYDSETKKKTMMDIASLMGFKKTMSTASFPIPSGHREMLYRIYLCKMENDLTDEERIEIEELKLKTNQD